MRAADGSAPAHTDDLSIRASLWRSLMFGSGRVVGQALNLAFLPFLLLYVSPEEFGAFAFLQTVALVWGVVMSLGLPTVFVSQYAHARDPAAEAPRLLGTCLVQQLVFGAALLAVGLVLIPLAGSHLAPETSGLALGLLLASELVANHVLLVARWQVMTGRHSQLSVVSAARSAAFIAVALLLVSVADLGIVGLAIADLASETVAALVCVVSAGRHARLQLRREDVRATVRLGLPAMPDTIFFWITVSAPFYFLRRGDLTAEAGAFGLAWRLASAVDLLGNSFAVGSAGELLRSGPSSSVQRMFRDTLCLVALATAALGAFAPEVIRWFFPSSMAPAVMAIPMACLGSYFLSAYYFEWVGLSGSRRTVGLTFAAAAGTIVGVTAFVLFPVSSAWQAGGIYALSLLAMWLAARWLRAALPFGSATAVLSGGVATVGASLVLQQFPVTPLGLAGKLAALSAIGAVVLRRVRASKR
jgi:O-antigen/teichoic acid export membrane protein